MKIYLTQVAQFIEKLTGKNQQIVKSSNPQIEYLEYQELSSSNDTLTLYSKENQMHMIIIADADIQINKISWSPDFGISLNSDTFKPNSNSNKVHCINWDTEEEVEEDEKGIFISEEGARNGILNITNPHYIDMSDEVFDEIMSYPI